MVFPLVVGIVAVALGILLALGPKVGAKSVGPIRVVSVIAAAGVILLHLLPEAWRAIGSWTAVAFLAGLVVPKGGEWIAENVSRRSRNRVRPGDVPLSTAALDVGYAGLVVHRFGDGLSMGAYARVPDSARVSAIVMLAFAAHIVPVTTVMVLAVSRAKGRRAAYFYGAGLGAAITAGVIAGNAALADLSHGVEPWISAVVAGLLLHVVVHTAGEGTSMFAAE